MNLYICITYYHVLIAIIKSIRSPGMNDLVICAEPGDSILAGDDRFINNVKKSGIFQNVYVSDFSRFSFAGGSLPRRLCKYMSWKLHIILYDTSWLDGYNKIFIFNDTVSLAKCLIKKKRTYILLEDGEDCYLHYKPDLKGGIQNAVLRLLGFSKPSSITSTMCTSRYIEYVEVNRAEGVQITNRKIVESPKRKMFDGLTREEKNSIISLFLDIDLAQMSAESTLILTQPLFEDGMVETEEKQIAVYRLLIQMHCSNSEQVIIKPHPRDRIEYEKYFPNTIVLSRYFPSEVLTFSDHNMINKAVTLYSTSIYSITNIKPDNKVLEGKEWLNKLAYSEKEGVVFAEEIDLT